MIPRERDLSQRYAFKCRVLGQTHDQHLQSTWQEPAILPSLMMGIKHWAKCPSSLSYLKMTQRQT
ncbi:hypothetical protein TRM7615_04479 [Falsiruegeria mediterranea M17]|uniref:Uncharacterized protein n=1 Tax=Falsiruegeria mediterranea M17 TaxID=1200281 RepID=A0A2R8CES4_9RHOB|nr:hypothetical protein TRM7615_04479 [Falsiruegeria mediterranea M17]